MPSTRRRAAAVRAAILLAVATALLAGGCAADDHGIEIRDARAAEPSGENSLAVLTITNDGGEDRLVGAETEIAEAVEIHRTEIEDGTATMRRLDGVDVPAGGEVRFESGGLHLMLTRPDETVREGERFELTLRFEHSGERTVSVDVVDLLDLAESGHATSAPAR